MSSTTTTTVERASKEFAWALIARIALTAGGYSLHPDKNNANSYGVMKRPEDYQKYYQIVKEYTSLVIASGTHSVLLIKIFLPRKAILKLLLKVILFLRFLLLRSLQVIQGILKDLHQPLMKERHWVRMYGENLKVIYV
jgi:hypothetical protein